MTTLTALELPVTIGSSRHGWYGVAGDDHGIAYVTIGHGSAAEAQQRMEHAQGNEPWVMSSLVRDAADEIARYLAGEPVDLSSIPIAATTRTPFQERVIAALRRVGYGQTVSYAELAERAGAPSAARAVGTVMSRNRLPLLIPCHRVIGSGGALGGFSAPTGISLKRALLDMEANSNRGVHS